MYPKRNNQNLVWRVIEGEAIILSGDGRRITLLNSSATLIWEMAGGENSLKDIVTALCDQYNVSPEVAEKDTLTLLQQMKEQGMIEILP